MRNPKIVNELAKWPILTMLDSELIAKIRMVFVFGKSGNEAFIVSTDDNVYALGSNKYGCLGTGLQNSVLYATEVEALCGKQIVKFISGGLGNIFVLALTKAGKLFSWGYNRNYELGNGSKTNQFTPIEIELNNIANIACGANHSLALTNEGQVYGWGHNGCGQIGNGSTSTNGTPHKLGNYFNGEKIVSIACASNSSYAVTETGQVYSWGDNKLAQLGLGHCSEVHTPRKIDSLAGVEIEKIFCGCNHVIALSKDGSLHSWGNNQRGQLGIGSTDTSNTPHKIPKSLVSRVVDIAALPSADISLAVDNQKRVFMWGNGREQSILIPTCTPFAHIYDALAHFVSIMHQPLEIHQEEEMDLINCMEQAFDDPETSDFTIEVEGKPIHVHKSILMIRSPYFRSMFQGQWLENKQSIMKHDHFSYEVYRLFLNYLYTDEVETSPENAFELLILANQYVQPYLKRCCVEIIKKKITGQNAAFLYHFAIVHESEDLEDFCLKYSFDHMTEVITSSEFEKLDRESMKNFIIKAARASLFKT